MDGNISTVNINLFALAPPNASGADYGNLVTNVHGVPIGQGEPSGDQVAQMLGFSSTDSVGPALNDIMEMAAKLNIGLYFPRGTIDQSIQVYLSNMDPTQPGLPPVKAMLIILERDLSAGKLGNVQLQSQSNTQVSSNSDSTTTTSTSTDGTAGAAATNVVGNTLDSSGGGGSGGGGDNSGDGKGNKGNTADVGNLQFNYAPPDNPLTASSPFTNALPNDPSVQKIMQNQDATINTGYQLNANNAAAIIHLGKPTGGNPWLAGNAYVAFLISFMTMERIMMQAKNVEGKIELNSMNLTWSLAQDTASAIMNIAEQNQMIHIAGAVMAGVTIGISLASFGIKDPTKAQTTSTIASSLGQFGQNAIQAATDIPIAEKEGAKELLQAIRTLVQNQMQKAADAFKSNEDIITQLLQTLDKMGDGLYQAISNALRR